MCVYPFLPRAVWDQWKDHFDHYDFSLTLLVVAILVYKEHEQEVTRFQVTSAYWNDLIWQILTSFLRIGEWQGVRLIPPCTTDEWCLLWLQFRKQCLPNISVVARKQKTRLFCVFVPLSSGFTTLSCSALFWFDHVITYDPSRALRHLSSSILLCIAKFKSILALCLVTCSFGWPATVKLFRVKPAELQIPSRWFPLSSPLLHFSDYVSETVIFMVCVWSCDNESCRTGEKDARPLINVAGRPAEDRGTWSSGNIPASLQVQHWHWKWRGVNVRQAQIFSL